MSEIAREITRLRELSVTQLADEYRSLFGREPRCKNKEHLWKRCAWKVQERRYGGLSGVAKQRLEELISEIALPVGERQRTVSGALRRRTRAPEHKVGTVFTRTWRGREIRAVAVQGGFEHEGILYSSLSAVARAVTGSHWNGRLFFGVTQRKRTK